MGKEAQEKGFGYDFERIVSDMLISSAATYGGFPVAAGASYVTFYPIPMVLQCSCHCGRRQMLRETEECHKAGQ